MRSVSLTSLPPPLLLLVLLLLGTTPGGSGVDAALPPKYTLCYFYNGFIDDLGWTFECNRHRVHIHNELKARYPTVEFDSLYVEDAETGQQYANKTKLVQDYVWKGCNVMVFMSTYMIPATSADLLWPNITFMQMRFNFFDTSLNNSYNFHFDYTNAYYITGAAAAAQADAEGIPCLGFVNSHSDLLPGPANGFILGARAVNSTIPIHVATLGNWIWREAEVEIAQQFIDRGCIIIGRYTNPMNIDQLVAKQPGEVAMTVGSHTDLSYFIGDSSMTSVYLNWTKALWPQIVRALHSSSPDVDFSGIPYYFNYQDQGVAISPALSPRAKPSTVAAVATAKARLAGNAMVYCNPLRLQDGSQPTLTGPQGCATFGESGSIQQYVDAGATIFHPQWQDVHGCPAGSFVTFGPTTSVIQWTCAPCPANTFSPTSGLKVCTPCATGWASAANSSTCYFVPAKSQTGVIVAAILSPIAVIVLLVFVLRLAAAKLQVANAPTDGKFYSVFVSMKNETKLWDTHGAAMNAVMKTYMTSVTSEAKAAGCYKVKMVGSAILLTAKERKNVLDCAIRLQLQLQKVDWEAIIAKATEASGDADAQSSNPRINARRYKARRANNNNNSGDETGSVTSASKNSSANASSRSTKKASPRQEIAFSFGLHYDSGLPTYDAHANTYDYTGPSVEGAAVASDRAQGGQILVTSKCQDSAPQPSDDSNFNPFTEVSWRKHKLSLLQYDAPGGIQRTYEDNADDNNNVDSITAALEQQASGVTLRRVVVACVKLPSIFEDNVRLSRDDFAESLKMKLTLVHQIALEELGALHTTYGNHVVLTFNAQQPTPAATLRAYTAVHRIRATVDSAATAGIATQRSITGALPLADNNKYQVLVCSAIATAMDLESLCSKFDSHTLCSHTMQHDVVSFTNASYVGISWVPVLSRAMTLLSLDGLHEHEDDDEWMYTLQKAEGTGKANANSLWETVTSGDAWSPEAILAAAGELSEEAKATEGFKNLQKYVNFCQERTDVEKMSSNERITAFATA